MQVDIIKILFRVSSADLAFGAIFVTKIQMVTSRNETKMPFTDSTEKNFKLFEK